MPGDHSDYPQKRLSIVAWVLHAYHQIVAPAAASFYNAVPKLPVMCDAQAANEKLERALMASHRNAAPVSAAAAPMSAAQGMMCNRPVLIQLCIQAPVVMP